jgi:hypothetical protein
MDTDAHGSKTKDCSNWIFPRCPKMGLGSWALLSNLGLALPHSSSCSAGLSGAW